MNRLAAALLLMAAPLVLSGCEDRGNQKLADANHLAELHKFDEAEKLIREVIAQYPDHAKAYNNLGFLYVARRQFDPAREAYNKAVELYQKHEPDNQEQLANTYDNLGFLEDLLGNNEAAVPWYQKAIETDPDLLRPHHNLGSLYREMRQYDKAIASLDRALEIDPYSYQTRVFKGLALLESGRYEPAVQLYTDLLAEDPFKVYLQTQLAHALMKSNQLDKAAQVLANCLAMNPGSPEARSFVALLRLEQGKPDEAKAIAAEIEKILASPPPDQPALRPTAMLLRNLGLVHAAAGDAQRAQQLLQQSRQLDPVDGLTEQTLEQLQQGAAAPAEAAQPAPQPAPAEQPTPAASAPQG